MADVETTDGVDTDDVDTDDVDTADETDIEDIAEADGIEAGSGSQDDAQTGDGMQVPGRTAEPDSDSAEEADDSVHDFADLTNHDEAADLQTNRIASLAGSEPDDSESGNSFAARTMSSTRMDTADADTADITTAVAPPSVPSLRLWPTAFDPTTAVTYVTGIVSSLVSAVLSPFAAGLPALPAEPPTLWTLLAWVRREFFNSSPTITYNPLQNAQSLTDGDVLIKGSIGAADADDDQLSYTVIGRPLNGGVVDVDDDGNFTYRPMNAMAAVGGTDQFVVVVDDEAAGLHINGLQGLLQFVPILGDLLNPGGGHRVAQTITVTVDPVAGVDLSFPDDFHWGVAHAGFQAEGGPGSPVDPNSDWYKWVHDPINQALGISNGVPENGPGTYVSYDSDAQLAHDELGMNTFRMSIEWSRIFSKSTASVDISDEGGGVSRGRSPGAGQAGQRRRGCPLCRGVRLTESARARAAGHRQPLHAARVGARPDHDACAGPARAACARRGLAVAGRRRSSSRSTPLTWHGSTATRSTTGRCSTSRSLRC